VLHGRVVWKLAGELGGQKRGAEAARSRRRGGYREGCSLSSRLGVSGFGAEPRAKTGIDAF